VKSIDPSLAAEAVQLVGGDRNRAYAHPKVNFQRIADLWARVLAAGDALAVRDLAVDGRDLMRELGLPPGKALGQLLDELLERVTEEPARNAPATLLALAREIATARGLL